MENEIERNKTNSTQLLKETKLIFPSINSMSMENHVIASGDSSNNAVLVFYDSGRKLKIVEKEKLKNWLSVRLKSDSVILVTKSY